MKIQKTIKIGLRFILISSEERRNSDCKQQIKFQFTYSTRG